VARVGEGALGSEEQQGGGHGGATEGQQTFVFDKPLDGFAARKLHGLGKGGRKVDVPLLAGLALDELDLGGESHEKNLLWNLVILLDTKKPVLLQQKSAKTFFSS
jgi:hypothetical protein